MSVVFKQDVVVKDGETVVWIDRGVANTMTISDGTLNRMPESIRKLTQKLERQHEKLAMRKYFVKVRIFLNETNYMPNSFMLV